MKKTFFPLALVLFTITLVGFKANNTSKAYEVDTQKTTALWTGTKITGKHNGSISLSRGIINYDGKTITGGEIEFDMNSITCSDLTNKEWNNKLVGHLKSDDFFDVGKFPAATFKITEATLQSGDNYEITGNLTIKEITHPVKFSAVVKASEKAIVTVATIKVNRTLYDIKYGSVSFFKSIGDKAISDEFELDVRVTAFPRK